MRVSIVIPVYNEEAYLKACLDSIAKQSLKPVEVIVVNNNSTDKTVDIAKRYPFVKVIKESRQGTVFARDTGFETAQGEILARIDADTRLPKDWTAWVSRAFEAPETAGVTGPPAFYDTPFQRFLNTCQVVFYQKFQKLLVGSYILWGANMAVRRSSWQAVKDSCAARVGIDEDIDLSLVLHKRGFLIRYMPSLRAAASLQRGRTDPAYTLRYLSTWPRDYILHRMHFKAAIISLLIILIVIGMVLSLPLLIIRNLLPKLK